MATLRGSNSAYDIGNKPPTITWTVVRGDTASFKVYVTDDEKIALNIPDWTIDMKVKRPNSATNAGKITDDATLIMELTPLADADDELGEFTVSLTSSESHILETGDIFDIQLSRPDHVWTIAQGSMVILEDVTD
jgi:hypothetical protein